MDRNQTKIIIDNDDFSNYSLEYWCKSIMSNLFGNIIWSN